MKLNWNFQRGGEVLEKIPSVGGVWKFSGTAQLVTFTDCRHGYFLKLHTGTNLCLYLFLFAAEQYFPPF